MDFAGRSYQKEILDRDDVPFEDIKQNMDELNIINKWLGGHSITLCGVKKIVGHKKDITICEIGCGGGDNLFFLKKWCDKKRIRAIFIGIDINRNCIEYAKSKMSDEQFEFIVSDYRLHRFPEKPDIIFSSLFCHHFKNEELVDMLKWLRVNSTNGFFINDLHRNAVAYYSIKWLTKIFSRSYLVKNDAPLSVLRGFQKKEWQLLLQHAGISGFSLAWKWAFRWLIVSQNKIE
jgi:ubiquinone/menaquinone biosynthesis C-methylase UbiE